MKNKIVLVPFPFDDLTGSKLRSALCLTNSIGTYDHVVVSFITSQVAKANESSDLQIVATDAEFNRTGLKVDSSVRLHRLATIPISLTQRQLDILPVSYWAILGQKLKSLFEL